MKAKFSILLPLLWLTLTACVKNPMVTVQSRSTETLPYELANIDSLMWWQPDSALTRIVLYFESYKDDEFIPSTAYDIHYANLLLAELLYKNDYAQFNRHEVRQAVYYFDSLLVIPEKHGVSPRKTGLSEASVPKMSIAFMAARSHYIKAVDHYENDSIVEACMEYLKALEVMEACFEEKDIIGHEARFMAYTYNRLGDIFSEQFMMESAIICYENALTYCRIESTSPMGISNIYYRIGKQYDKKGEKRKANEYYTLALERMPNHNNIVYRDLVSTKALNEYQLGVGIDHSINTIKQILLLSDNENEQLTRYLTISAMFFEEKMYDSALCYLEPIFENKDNLSFSIRAAEYLRVVYDSLGNDEKMNECIRFLAFHKDVESENKVLVSELEAIFQTYLDQKREKASEEEREKSIRKTISIIVPIAIAVVLIIIIAGKARSKKILKEQQKEAEMQHERSMQQQKTETEILLEEKNKQLEREKKARQREKEKLQQGIQQREEQVNNLKKALNHQRNEAELRREAFLQEAICRKINDSIRSQSITARNSHEKYVAFTEEDAAALKYAVLRHYENFETMLLGKYSRLSNTDLQLCQLYLLGLDERQIAVLQNKSYSAIKKRTNTLKGMLGLEESLGSYLLKFSSFKENEEEKKPYTKQ